MKRILSMFLLCVLVFTVSGCGAVAKPEDTVSNFLNAAKEFDLEKMSTYVVSENAGKISELDSEDETEQYFLDYLKECASKMSYEIKSSIVTDDSAVVTVNFKYIDSSLLLASVIQEVFSQAIASAFSGAELTDEQQSAMFTDAIQKYRDSAVDSYIESKVDVNCTKTDDGWLIDSVNDDLGNVLMSNFINASDGLSSSFGDSDDNSDAEAESATPQVGSGVLGDYSVSIDNFELTQDYNSNPSVVITYSWTNNSTDTTNFMSSLNTQVFQNGIECDSAILSSDYDSDSSMKDIKPGTTLSVQEAYTLQDSENPIEIEVSEFLNFSNTPSMVTQIFELK